MTNEQMTIGSRNSRNASRESRETLRKVTLSRFAVFARFRGFRDPNALLPLYNFNFLLRQSVQLTRSDQRVDLFVRRVNLALI